MSAARALLALVAGALLACGEPDGAPPPARNGTAVSPVTSVDGWTVQRDGSIAFRDTRDVDFTGDGVPEQVLVDARGTSYDSLEIALVIRDAAGDSLWVDRWPGTLYFVYEDRAAFDDSTAARVVRGHVAALLADSAFHTRGLPARYTSGNESMLRESVRYHLAELDWRRAADLTPSGDTPPAAHDRIRAETVSRDRVDLVIREAAAHPTFIYFGGGEVSTMLGWSEREHAFVRLFHCC